MDIFNYLSTPFEGDFAALAAELAATQYRAFCGRALRLAGTVGQGQDALVRDIAGRIAQREATTAYWTPEVGAIFSGLRKESFTLQDWHWVRTQIALSAHLTGLTSSLELEVETNAPLLVCGQKIPAARLAIHADARRLRIQVDSEAEPRLFSVFGQRQGSPLWADARSTPVFIELDGAPAIRLVGHDWHSIWAEDPCVTAPGDGAAVAQFHQALELLGSALPRYRDWVVCLLKEVTPLRRPGENMIASSSSALRMGGIDLSVPASPTETAEMMIHECTHQYFHMASWMGSTVTADARPHFSPLKGRERPLDRILLGYHAFGNALIAFDRFGELGLGPQIAQRLSTVNGYMDRLRVPVEKEEGLSELGLALYRPLRARLESRARQA